MNADDLGATAGINRGIARAHRDGIVTSASLMVHGRAVEDAVAVAAAHPDLDIGLHWDLDAGGVERVDMADADAVRAELQAQVHAFEALLGRRPTHLDSHHHVHRSPEIAPAARELAAALGVPLRGEGPVSFVGGFYGQWEWMVTDLGHISPDFLIWILRNEVGDGWTELSCHPGFVDDDLTSVYRAERATEVETLTDPRVRAEVEALGIELASYAALRLDLER
ncbi:MAG TPA: ChbG/HpnK family deacetylase [Solirubrobacteraceae bacterium]|nr:ChbG/HpnK family deacetylase [Solirubrobacteraceae bacterium]